MNECVLVISDTHFPYQHQDTFHFLKEIKDQYAPDRIIHIGDEVDHHGLNFHGIDPDLPSHSDELEKAKACCRQLASLFPKIDLLESNHGSLSYRRAKASGMSSECMKPYRDILGAPKSWRWHYDLTIKLPNGQEVYFTHGRSGRGLARTEGVNCVQGHYHQKMGIQFYKNSRGNLIFDAFTGCLISDSRAFAYNRTDTIRPSLGLLMIINSIPLIQPLHLNKRGKWLKKVL